MIVVTALSSQIVWQDPALCQKIVFTADSVAG